MKTDVSIHFTTKGQTIEDLNRKFNDYISQNQDTLPFDFSEKSNPRTVLHHCFLPETIVQERGWSNDIYDTILHPTSEHKVCWYGVSGYGLAWDRTLMLENLSKLNGVAVFIGDIVDGVKNEYDLCVLMNIDILLIP